MAQLTTYHVICYHRHRISVGLTVEQVSKASRLNPYSWLPTDKSVAEIRIMLRRRTFEERTTITRVSLIAEHEVSRTNENSDGACLNLTID